ncbi:uncharacterized protein K02A2.6-like [Haliotis rufescens]|uniref:uncharacterized protein K02A2.6-like n=1 Tax=Haliotis rufescens TaxID=6454 RepID=UPI001EAFD83C|nr:uncharacterized protein K02A2.6-like [Haliotis rufescens]
MLDPCLEHLKWSSHCAYLKLTGLVRHKKKNVAATAYWHYLCEENTNEEAFPPPQNESKKKHSSRVHRVDDDSDESDIDPTEELMTIYTCEESVNCVVGQYPTKIFTTLEVNSQPVRFQPLRRIPHALKQDPLTELERLEKRGVITPVDTPTDWVSSLLIVKKPSGCIDPKPLDKALKRCHYPLPVMEDILPDIAEAKAFSKCDLKDGFWHIVLDEDSSYLTNFGTPFGRYRWLRLPFGVSPAPEIFQQRIDQLLQDLPGVFRIADDILIIGEGSTKEEGIANHDKRFVQFMLRCREKGIRLNSDKLDLKGSEVSYIGHLLTDHGP